MADARSAKGKGKMAPAASSANSSTESNTYTRFAADRQTTFLVNNHANFRNTAEPDHVIFYDADGKWDKYPDDIQKLAKGCFRDKIPTIEAVISRRNVLLDFYRMLEVDFESGYERSIGWIDVTGKFSLPKVCVNSGRDYGIGVDRVEVTSKRKYREGGGDTEAADKVGPIPYEVVSSPKWPGTTVLIQGLDDEYEVVKKLFLGGLRDEAKKFITVTRIHQIVHESPMWSRRGAAFTQLSAAVARRRGGVASETYAWYGASAASICRYLHTGKLRPEDLNFTCSPRGVGVYLSSSFSSRLSAVYADRDGGGEKHVVLCRVVLGKTETVIDRSQVFPSSSGFDTGVDAGENPKWHIVWPADMNTHIAPEMVVSFSGDGYEDLPRNDGELPSTFCDYAVVVSRIGKTLPASPARDLQQLFGLWKNAKIVEEVFRERLTEFIEERRLRDMLEEIRGSRAAAP